MDPWAWSDHLAPWVACRTQLPLGPLFCVLNGATRSGADSRRISSAMLTLSSSPAKACRYP